MGGGGEDTRERGQTCLMNAQHSARTFCNHFSGSRTHFPAKPRYIDIGAQISGRGRAGDGGGGGRTERKGGGSVKKLHLRWGGRGKSEKPAVSSELASAPLFQALKIAACLRTSSLARRYRPRFAAVLRSEVPLCPITRAQLDPKYGKSFGATLLPTPNPLPHKNQTINNKSHSETRRSSSGIRDGFEGWEGFT